MSSTASRGGEGWVAGWPVDQGGGGRGRHMHHSGKILREFRAFAWIRSVTFIYSVFHDFLIRVDHIGITPKYHVKILILFCLMLFLKCKSWTFLCTNLKMEPEPPGDSERLRLLNTEHLHIIINQAFMHRCFPMLRTDKLFGDSFKQKPIVGSGLDYTNNAYNSVSRLIWPACSTVCAGWARVREGGGGGERGTRAHPTVSCCTDECQVP